MNAMGGKRGSNPVDVHKRSSFDCSAGMYTTARDRFLLASTTEIIVDPDENDVGSQS